MEPPVLPHGAPTVWVLADPVVGHASQSLGVAEALGWPFETRTLAYGALARLPGFTGPRHLCGLDGESRTKLASPWPDIVIATGGRLGGVARWVRRQAARDGHKVFLAQMMDPRRGRDEFDLIAAPQHDHMAPAANVIATLGAPTRVTAARLAEAAEAWRGRLEDLPRPRIAVLVGGTAGGRRFDAAMASELGRQASHLAAARSGSLMVTTSRRTGDAEARLLINSIAVPSYVHRWAPSGSNPYYAFLGLADAVIVTGESVSMASEAAEAGKPLFIYAPPALVKPAFAGFHKALYDAGLARPLAEGASLDGAAPSALGTAAKIAEAIRARLR